MKRIVFYNGEFVEYDSIKIGLSAHALHYGTGCFEGIRSYWNKETKKQNIFRAKEHYERMINSCKILMISIPYSADKLVEITIEVIKKNNHKEDAYIRPIAFKGEDKILTFDLPNIQDSFAIFTLPMGHYLNIAKGIKVCTSSWRRISDNAIPARAKLTGAYINTALAKFEAVSNGYGEAIFLTESGHVSEGSAENIFIVKKGKIYTPSVSDDILEGITRNTLIELLDKEFNIKVEERSIDRTELYAADEIFLVGTGAEVTPVTEIDNRQVGKGKIGPLTKKLQAIYFDIVHANNNKYNHWITSI
jgi:branched-chain amino acid aminotransferase